MRPVGNSRRNGLSGSYQSPVMGVLRTLGKVSNDRTRVLAFTLASARLMSTTLIAKLSCCPSGRCQVLSPTSSDSMVTSGPPLLPAEMAAVVCTQVASSA